MPDQIIEVKTQQIYVNPPSGRINIYGYGLQGPEGPPGPPGSGADLAWPVIAPADSTGNVNFTPSNVLNDVRGLQTMDTASWMRFWDGPPYSLWFRANSGPMTGGLNGSMTFDADRVDFRNSAGLATYMSLTATGPTFHGAVTMLTDTSTGGLGNLYLGPNPGQAGDEGGQLNFLGTAPYTGEMYIDRLSDTLRVVSAGQVIAGFTSGPSLGFMMGQHPVHSTLSGIWRPSTPAQGDYLLLQGVGASYLNTSSGGTIYLRAGNADMVTIGAGRNMALTAGINGITMGWGGAIYQEDSTWMRTSCGFYNGGNSIANDGYFTCGRGGTPDGTWRVWFAVNTRSGGTLYCDGTTDTQYLNARKVAGGSWSDQTVLCNPGTSMAGYGLHPGGVASCIRMQQNNNRIHMNNSDSGWYVDISAASYTVASSLAKKSNVIDMQIARPIDVVKELRPIWFQTPSDLIEPIEIFDIEHPDLGAVEIRHTIHDCDTSPHCTGTSANPCQRIKTFDHGRIGFGAEEVAALFPAASVFDMDGVVIGYDLPAIVALVVGAVRNLNDDQSDILSRLISLERKAVA
jgi:hypothetical protein